MAKVLITGGTGLLGDRILTFLREKDYEIHVLSRRKSGIIKGVRYWKWDIDEAYIEEGALNVDHIIHLAGAGVVDKRWTAPRKKEILDSRVLSTRLLYETIKRKDLKIKSIVSTSAVGIYGNRGEVILKEAAAAANDFLAAVCVQWEKEARQFENELSIPTSILRVGIVLSKNGGALPKLSLPIKFGIGAYLGNGKQYYPWIHIDDVARMFIYAIENDLNGVYNATAPTPETNKGIAKHVAKVLMRPFIPAPAPKFVLKAVMGEMANMLLNSQNATSKKIVNAGFKFKFPELEEALGDIFNRNV